MKTLLITGVSVDSDERPRHACPLHPWWCNLGRDHLP